MITSSPASAAALVNAARIEASALLRDHAHIFAALADELLFKRTMSGEEIDQCIARGRGQGAKAVADERQRRRDWHEREANAKKFIAMVEP